MWLPIQTHWLHVNDKHNLVGQPDDWWVSGISINLAVFLGRVQTRLKYSLPDLRRRASSGHPSLSVHVRVIRLTHLSVVLVFSFCWYQIKCSSELCRIKKSNSLRKVVYLKGFEMKLFSALFFVSAVTLTASEFVSTVYNSIEEFKAINPDAKIIQMTAQDHAVDGSRSYSLGSRQTGRKKNKNNILCII